MKRILFFIIVFSLYIIKVNPQELNANLFFNEKDITRVINGDIITRMYLKNNAVAENTDLSINVPKTKYINENLNVYEMITDEKAFIPYKLDEASKLRFYNAILAISKYKNANYFSRRIQKVQTLIVDSYRIESPEKDKKIPDMVDDKIEPKTTGYFIQKDNIFGKLLFKSEVYNEGSNFILINTVLQPIAKFVFNICGKEEDKFITYFIYDEKKSGFYYYTVNIMRIKVESMLKKGNNLTLYPTTFSNRLRAATVQFVKLLGINWDSKLNPWDEDMLEAGKYRNY